MRSPEAVGHSHLRRGEGLLVIAHPLPHPVVAALYLILPQEAPALLLGVEAISEEYALPRNEHHAAVVVLKP